MQRFYFIILVLLSCQVSFCETNEKFKITSKIINQKKAKEFNEKYTLILPCHDYKNALNLSFAGLLDTVLTSKKNESYILNNDIYGKTINSLTVKKTTSGKTVLSEIWMTPLNHDNNGYIYLDNNKIVLKKYNTNVSKELSIGKDISSSFDRHCIASQGDSLFYFTTADYNRKKKLFGKDTSIVDFDFYEWNSNTDKTIFLFSASSLIPDSMLVPNLFDDPERGIYEGLDIYHWNWLQKINNKLLINFAYTGFLQVDINTRKIDWFWGNNGHSFSKIKGIGKINNPYYTHDLNLISSGKYKGCYSYFENGQKGDSINPMRPARATIFRINESENSVEILFEKEFDIPSVALGSIDVSKDFVVVNLGMIIPIKGILSTMATSGKATTIEFWKQYKHPQVYVYDLQGNEVSNYVYPFAFYSYSAWSKKK
jgi:hypothetical protein